MFSFIKKLLKLRNVPKSPTTIAILLCYDSYFGPHAKEEINKFLIPIIEHVSRKKNLSVNVKIPGVTMSSMLWSNYKFVEKLVSMAGEGRVEFMGCGFSNSFLPILDRGVAFEQVLRYRDYLRSVFDMAPRGFVFPFDGISREIMPVLRENDYKYFVCEDYYIDAESARNLVDIVGKKAKPGEIQVSNMLYHPRKVIYENCDLTGFLSFTEFSSRLTAASMGAGEKSFFQFVDEAINFFHLFDRASLITFKIDLSEILDALQNNPGDPARAVKVITDFLDYISECEHITVNLYENWFTERAKMLYENRNQINLSSDNRKYSACRTPSLYGDFSLAAANAKRLEELDGFVAKVQNFQRIHSSLLRTEREKISYNPLIELSRTLGLFYQYSFGGPEGCRRNSQCFDNFRDPERHLSYVNEVRLKTKGVFVEDIDGDGNDEIMLINDRIFAMMNGSGELKSFINLPSGAESISAIPVCPELSKRSHSEDPACASDYYWTGSEESSRRVAFSYKPTQSVLVGAQFGAEDETVSVSRSVSLYNNALVLRYNIKNVSGERTPFNYCVRLAFAPDHLSVIKFGKPVLGFYSGDDPLESDHTYEIGEHGIGVVNKLNGNFVYVNGSRILPGYAVTSVHSHSFGIDLIYSLPLDADEEVNFIINLAYNRG